MGEVITWLYNRCGQPVFYYMDCGTVNMMIFTEIEDIEIFGDFIKVWHDNGYIDINSGGVIACDEDELRITYPVGTIVFIIPEE